MARTINEGLLPSRNECLPLAPNSSASLKQAGQATFGGNMAKEFKITSLPSLHGPQVDEDAPSKVSLPQAMLCVARPRSIIFARAPISSRSPSNRQCFHCRKRSLHLRSYAPALIVAPWRHRCQSYRPHSSMELPPTTRRWPRFQSCCATQHSLNSL